MYYWLIGFCAIPSLNIISFLPNLVSISVLGVLGLSFTVNVIRPYLQGYLNLIGRLNSAQ